MISKSEVVGFEVYRTDEIVLKGCIWIEKDPIGLNWGKQDFIMNIQDSTDGLEMGDTIIK